MKRTVTENYPKFAQLTEFNALGHLLLRWKLLTQEQFSILVGVESKLQGEQKARYFYVEILHTKGKMAYTLLWQCLALETNHIGHGELLDLLNTAIEEEK